MTRNSYSPPTHVQQGNNKTRKPQLPGFNNSINNRVKKIYSSPNSFLR